MKHREAAKDAELARLRCALSEATAGRIGLQQELGEKEEQIKSVTASLHTETSAAMNAGSAMEAEHREAMHELQGGSCSALYYGCIWLEC